MGDMEYEDCGIPVDCHTFEVVTVRPYNPVNIEYNILWLHVGSARALMPNCMTARQSVPCSVHYLKTFQNLNQLRTQKGMDTYSTWVIVHKLCTAHDVNVCDVFTLILGVHDIYLHGPYHT